VKLNINQLTKLRSQLVWHLSNQEISILLDSNQCEAALNIGNYELLAAWQPSHFIITNSFSELKKFSQAHSGHWMFGSIAYDAKNDIEQLHSHHTDIIGFPDICFFVPQKLIIITRDLEILAGEELVMALLDMGPYDETTTQKIVVNDITQTVSAQTYIKNVSAIIQHIEEGDVYELNYCMQWQAKPEKFHLADAYIRLTQKSPVPFAAFYKLNSQYLICASPERFICKKGEAVYSQPIKGTTARGKDEAEDTMLKNQLLNSEKERAENLMIVDLVRNDLARSAVKGSIKVDELFGIYSYPQVHQMISTVSAKVVPGTHWTDVLRHAFPMGSMTGAPKIKAMQLIEQYECTRRGLYSGTVGYITPQGDFDFNVVIRSIQYNALNNTIAFSTGSAITYDSNPEKEFDECLLKAKAIFDVLKNK
jgi:para-aminobenzoate synthetase component 1